MQTSVACLILPIACRLFSRAPLLFLLQVYLILSKFAQVRLQRSPPRRREDCACRNTGGFLSTASSPEQNLFCLSTSLYPVSLLSMMKKLCLVDLVFVQLHRLSFFFISLLCYDTTRVSSLQWKRHLPYCVAMPNDLSDLIHGRLLNICLVLSAFM